LGIRLLLKMSDIFTYKKIIGWKGSIVRFYLDGFRSMTVGKTLWRVILIKLFVIFVLLKVFFFSDYLQANFTDDGQRINHVLEQLTLHSKIHTGETINKPN
jgi:Domain of unknown function (DUF4492)